MPYDNTSELPDNIKKLSSSKQRQWMHVWNSAYNSCINSNDSDKSKCESKAFAEANGVVLSKMAMKESLSELLTELKTLKLQEAGRVHSKDTIDRLKQILNHAANVKDSETAQQIMDLAHGLIKDNDDVDYGAHESDLLAGQERNRDNVYTYDAPKGGDIFPKGTGKDYNESNTEYPLSDGDENSKAEQRMRDKLAQGTVGIDDGTISHSANSDSAAGKAGSADYNYPSNPYIGTDKNPLKEAEFNTKKRKELADEGKALPDGSYPIENEKDLENAYKDWASPGRGGRKANVKEHILKRARALGVGDEYEAKFNGKENVKEARVGLKLSHEEVRDKVSKAVHAQHGYHLNPVEMHDDHGIYHDYGNDEHYMIPHKISEDGIVKLGDKQKVRRTYQTIKESAVITPVAPVQSEGENAKAGTKWEVSIIKAGVSKNGIKYTPSVLREAINLFEGVTAYADHDYSRDTTGHDRSIRDKIGKIINIKYNDTLNAITGTLKVISPWVRSTLLEAYELGEPDFVGLSVDVEGQVKRGRPGDNYKFLCESIVSVNSVDLVSTPSAGGEVLRLVASNTDIERLNNREIGDNELGVTREQLAEMIREGSLQAIQEATKNNVNKQALDEVVALREALRKDRDLLRIKEAVNNSEHLSDVGKERVRKLLEALVDRRAVEDDDIVSAIKEAVKYEAAVAQKYGNPTSLGIQGEVRLGLNTYDRYDAAIRGMFTGEDEYVGTGDNKQLVKHFRSIREAYSYWNGINPFDINPVAMFDELKSATYSSYRDHKKIRESVNIAQWGNIYADNLYIQLMKAYRTVNYSAWTALCSEIQDVPDFQTQHWIRIGGYADLSTVAEEGTYPQLTSPSDQAVTYSLTKRGGIDDVTFEAIVNDRVQAIRRIPIAMGRAAARTLFKFVVGQVTDTNPTMSYDSVALYSHASHANQGDSGGSNLGLSVQAVAYAKAQMRLQTAFGESNEFLGERNVPKFLIVPSTLEERAQRICMPSDAYLAAVAYNSGYSTGPISNNTQDLDQAVDVAAFKNKLVPLVYDFASTQTEWFLVANPQEVPTIVVGFLNGQRDPELFVQDQPTVGSVFTADKISYKVRHIYSAVVEDHRSFYKGST